MFEPLLAPEIVFQPFDYGKTIGATKILLALLRKGSLSMIQGFVEKTTSCKSCTQFFDKAAKSKLLTPMGNQNTDCLNNIEKMHPVDRTKHNFYEKTFNQEFAKSPKDFLNN